jgi:GTP-binding protein HflX
VSLVGYTNAGKSTLFNALSDAGVAVQDQPFSTLDPVTRRIWLPAGGQVLLTDTVGFIHKLPPTVVDAFRATLEELQQTDLLLHVIDITHPKAPEQVEVVGKTLDELGLGDKPKLMVVNKMDLVVPRDNGKHADELPVLSRHPSVLVSAALGWNLDVLLEETGQVLESLGVASPSIAAKR